MMISTKGRYALRVMIELAKHDPDKYIPLKDIAETQSISGKYLESIIKLLVKGNMVIGLRGKGGGYKLSREPESYTVLSILKLAEGSLAPVACLSTDKMECERAESCPTLPMWSRLNDIITEYLESVYLSDLASQAKDACCGDYVI